MPTIDFTGIILPQFFQGFAVACFFLPLTTISFSGLPDNKLVSCGIFLMARIIMTLLKKCSSATKLSALIKVA
jgi:hypothetical protein